ncbi:Putative ribonuclease H protein At1g65750 [Linum perenne]
MEPPCDALGEDGIIWGPDPRGKFTLKTAYEILDSADHLTEQDFWRIVWRWEGPSWVRHFLWLVAHDRILTNAERRRRHLAATDECQRCRVSTEDTLHVVRDCQEAHIGWKAGPCDTITINTDGSVLHPHSKAAAGGILCNHLGRPISTFAANLGCCSIMRAELRAAQFGLMIAWDRGFKKVHLQLDSLAAVSAILGGQGEDSRHGRTLDTINELRSRNWNVTISHTYREGNTVADLLAHHGHTLDFGLHIDCMYPHEVDRAIWSDHVGTCFPRFISMNE